MLSDSELTLEALKANLQVRAGIIVNKMIDAQADGRFEEAMNLRSGYDELVYVLSQLGVDKSELGLYDYEQ